MSRQKSMTHQTAPLQTGGKGRECRKRGTGRTVGKMHEIEGRGGGVLEVKTKQKEQKKLARGRVNKTSRKMAQRDVQEKNNWADSVCKEHVGGGFGGVLGGEKRTGGGGGGVFLEQLTQILVAVFDENTKKGTKAKKEAAKGGNTAKTGGGAPETKIAKKGQEELERTWVLDNTPDKKKVLGKKKESPEGQRNIVGGIEGVRGFQSGRAQCRVY